MNKVSVSNLISLSVVGRAVIILNNLDFKINFFFGTYKHFFDHDKGFKIDFYGILEI